jgi:hypothetical protein
MNDDKAALHSSGLLVLKGHVRIKVLLIFTFYLLLDIIWI